MYYSKIKVHTFLGTTIGALMLSANANADLISDTEFGLTGSIKVDALFSNYSNGTLPAQSLGRDFYVPGATPVGGVKESTQFDAHAKQTRFRFTSTTDAGNNNIIKGIFELDFLVTPGGNERVSNSYVPRIRHAFVEYSGWTIGQTWTTFQDIKTLPESVDFIGVPDGIAFNRQALLRYQTGAWEFALENSESTITPFGGGARIVSDDGFIPDAVVRYTHKADWGHFSVATLLRQLSYETATIDESASSYGISMNSKIYVGDRDDLRISFTSGIGLGRYLAINASNGAVLDSNSNLSAIESSGFTIAYRKVWSGKIRSNFMFAALSVDNDIALTGATATQSTYSVSANIMYSPVAKITFGAEIKRANREIESGISGDMTRLQFMAKYSF
ncbi:DcaP family trimeric outer membrane transporter [Glaciecola sp. SC05]|uniref:DcaP family trimeric outer membrane transporter n=1 Tax=Glaciecola sp. SC05 TaxID=1987355 RepID=UPI003529AFBC